MTLAVRILEDPAELPELEPAWRALWERTPDATPFQHPDWELPWWHHLGKGRLCMLAAESDGRLRGLLPLCLLATDGRLVLRPLAFDLSDYAEPLIGRDEPAVVMAALQNALAKVSGWHACEFVLRERAGFGVHAPAGELRVGRSNLEPAPVLDLSPGYPECLPRGIRKSLAEASRRLRKLNGAEFECATPATIPGVLESLFGLHRRRWRERRSAGVLDHPAVQSFHREAASRLCASGLLRLYRMRIQNRDAAVLYAMAAKGTVYYYIGGFDPDRAAISPGSLVIDHAIERAVREGQQAFDFLKGQENYKYRWGAADRGRCRYEITWAGEPADAAALGPSVCAAEA